MREETEAQFGDYQDRNWISLDLSCLVHLILNHVNLLYIKSILFKNRILKNIKRMKQNISILNACITHGEVVHFSEKLKYSNLNVTP